VTFVFEVIVRILIFYQENEKAKDKGLVVLNQDAIISEIGRLGFGLIKKVSSSN